MLPLKQLKYHYKGFRKAGFSRIDTLRQVRFMYVLSRDIAIWSKENGKDDLEALKRELRDYYKGWL